MNKLNMIARTELIKLSVMTHLLDSTNKLVNTEKPLVSYKKLLLIILKSLTKLRLI